MTTPDTPESPEIDFTEFLEELDRGNVSEELGTKLLSLIDAVKSTKKQGTLTLKLTIGWDKGADMIRVSNQVADKKPSLPRAESMFFVTDEGVPSRQDPRQIALELENQKRMERAGNIVDFSEPRRSAGDN